MEGAPLSGFLPVGYGSSVLSPAHFPQRRLLTAKGLEELQAGWVARWLQKRWDALASGAGTCALRGTCSFPRHVPCPGWTLVLPPPLCAPLAGPFQYRGASCWSSQGGDRFRQWGLRRVGDFWLLWWGGGSRSLEVSTVLVCCVCSSWHKLPGLSSAPAGMGTAPACSPASPLPRPL